jgi:MmgE/PrpD N-terminal domain
VSKPYFIKENEGMTQVANRPATNQHGQQSRPAVKRIASFAAAARPEQLTQAVRQPYKRSILESLGCALAALHGPPFRALKEQI